MIIVAVVAGRANQKGTDKIMTASVFTPHIKLEHVISFSDAVFAFAITLMALSIDIPDLPLDLTQSELLEKLYGIYPQFENYLISFAVVAIFWISYHQVFNHIRGSHISMVYLNLLFILNKTSSGMGLSVIKCERTSRLENIALYSPSFSWVENIDDEGGEKECDS